MSAITAPSLGLITLALCGATVGCAPGPALHANLSTPELNERLSQRFSPGMTRSEVEASLDEAGQRAARRLWNDSPPALLARIEEPGGLWISEPNHYADGFDVVFRFDQEVRLADWRAHPTTLRYDFGRPFSRESVRPRGWPPEPLENWK